MTETSTPKPELPGPLKNPEWTDKQNADFDRQDTQNGAIPAEIRAEIGIDDADVALAASSAKRVLAAALTAEQVEIASEPLVPAKDKPEDLRPGKAGLKSMRGMEAADGADARSREIKRANAASAIAHARESNNISGVAEEFKIQDNSSSSPTTTETGPQ